MKFIILFAALFAIAMAAPSDVQTVRSDSDVRPESYKYGYETSDGTSHDEEGKIKDVGTDHEANVVHGTFSWVDEKTGEKFTTTYFADESGFHAEGAHIPTLDTVPHH